MALMLRAARAGVVLATVAPLLAQIPDAAAESARLVCVRDAKTGLPLPGVAVRVGHRHEEESHLVDGWLLRCGRRPAARQAVRSDPDGRVTLTAAEARQLLTVEPEFRLVEDRRSDAEPALVVERNPHHAVQVVDASGRAVADFSLCAQGLGAVERTDASGLATFACQDPGLAAARGVVPTFVPVQWIGSPGSMPKVAVARGAGVTRMRVPPHVTLRLRFLRHGVPTAVAVDAGWLSLPVEHALWGARATPRLPLPPLPPVTCRGIEVGPVAWTGEVRGEVRIGRLTLPFGSTTLPATGRVLEIDLETDPPRPRLTGVVRLSDGATPATVRLGAATDAGVFHDQVAVGANGRMLASFDAERLRGTVLRRVWVDAIDPPGSAAVALAREVPLRDAELDLGDVVMAAHEPVLRGRVVDARGVPLATALATVRAAGPGAPPAVTEIPVDGAGRFTLAGPLFRGANGDVVPATASAAVTPPPARRGVRAAATAPFQSAPSPPTPPGGEVELVVPDAATGALALVVQGTPPSWRSQLQAQRLVDGNQLLLHARDLATTNDASAWQAGSSELPAGRSRFRLLTMNQLVYEVELEIAPARPSDPRAVLAHTVDFDAIVRQRSVRAIDEAGRAVPEARVHVRSNGHRAGVMPDERGDLTWLEPVQLRHAAYLVAPGRQVIRLSADAAGAVTIVPAVPVAARLRNDDGTPVEGRWTVMLDPCDDTGLAVHAAMAGDGAVHFPGPAPGRYHVAVFRDFPQFERRVRIATGTVADGRLVPAELSIDAAARTALRALQQEPRPAK